ncbi:hypothetical protein [Parahaliea aestuarii]|uniref:Uncharacterized protein n=1 Tax=Parahaliea aestuarii TaxID=1852021 RepID=A0A5C8ZVG5_9GAMM|nr:hypothetical protein [Parahaliea aestuarii]TXS92478.1 hypothetical protein FVW59_08655 [Parahaliea aestuarii]
MIKILSHWALPGPFLLLALLLGSFAIASEDQSGDSRSGTSDIRGEISIYSLIVSPADFLHDQVIVRGYLDFGATLSLYPNKLAADIRDDASSISIEDPTDDGSVIEQCSGRYVKILGVISRDSSGEFYMGDVEYAYNLEPLGYCWKLDK